MVNAVMSSIQTIPTWYALNHLWGECCNVRVCMSTCTCTLVEDSSFMRRLIITPRNVDYFNAKGSFLNNHTIEAVSPDGKKVREFF